MIRAAGPVCSRSPELGSKGDHRQQEEDAGDLQPQDTSHAPEGTQKSAHAANEISRSLPGRRTHGAPAGISAHFGFKVFWRQRTVLGRAGKEFFRELAGNSQADTECTSYVLSSHLRYDGSSGGG